MLDLEHLKYTHIKFQQNILLVYIQFSHFISDICVQYRNVPVNVMPKGGKDGQTVGILDTENNCVRISTIWHDWMSESPMFPWVHAYFCYKIQCQNSWGSIMACQNPQGWRNIFNQNPPGYPYSAPCGISLTGA